MSSGSATQLIIERVRWDDPRAQALQQLLETEMLARYSEPSRQIPRPRPGWARRSRSIRPTSPRPSW